MGHPRLVQGPTSGTGLKLRTEATLAGEPPPAEFALWYEISTPELPVGKTVILFGRRSVTGNDGPATADGQEVVAFHVAVSTWVLEQRDGEIARMCRGGNSEPASDDVLDEL